MGGDFNEDINLYERKCRQHLARAKLALLLGCSSAASAELAAHHDLVQLAIGSGDHTASRVEEALTKSLFLDLKVNFELFLWTACRTWLRWDFVGSMRRLNRKSSRRDPGLRKFIKEKTFEDVFADVERFLPAHGLTLLWALLDGFTPEGLRAELDPQVKVAFEVRHIVEHRNGRMDQEFVSACHRLWKSTSWQDVDLRLGSNVPVRPIDFARTYETMDDATQTIARRLREVRLLANAGDQLLVGE